MWGGGTREKWGGTLKNFRPTLRSRRHCALPTCKLLPTPLNDGTQTEGFKAVPDSILSPCTASGEINHQVVVIAALATVDVDVAD